MSETVYSVQEAHFLRQRGLSNISSDPTLTIGEWYYLETPLDIRKLPENRISQFDR